ncbi:hypothetical protein BC829DRAFT_443868 [Chytridium lagenaria]|nr:hypothetical protein BC829DRAFT_443868 [Chytridium lagenaria]
MTETNTLIRPIWCLRASGACAPLPSLKRAVIVFESPTDAHTAKFELDSVYEDGPPRGHAQALLKALKSLPDDGFRLDHGAEEDDEGMEGHASAASDYGTFHVGDSHVKAQGTWHHPGVASAVISSLESNQNVRQLLTFGLAPSTSSNQDSAPAGLQVPLPVIVVDDFCEDSEPPSRKITMAKTARPPMPW